MVRALAAGLGFALAIAACGPAPTPSPTAAPSATPDPRLTVLDDRAATWKGHQPPTYAYTFTHAATGMPSRSYSYRVTSMEGHVEAQRISGVEEDALGPDRMAVEGMFDTARTALAGPGELEWTFDRLLGYPTQLAYTSPEAGGSWTETVSEFTTAADRGGATRAREAMTEALTSWGSRAAGDYELTWSRLRAADGGSAPTTWRVRHEGGRTTVAAEGEGDGSVAPDEATVERTIATAAAALAGGGWVDLAIDAGSNPGLLLAVDPSPSVTGDAYWIRTTYRDIAEDAAAADLAAAKARWAAAAPAGYSYTWRYRGAGGPLTYRVTRNGEKTTVKRGAKTPVPNARAYAVPRIEDTFAMLEEVLAQGGRVIATYDPKLGYPRRAEMFPAGDAGAKGVITIRSLKIR